MIVIAMFESGQEDIWLVRRILFVVDDYHKNVIGVQVNSSEKFHVTPPSG